MRKQSPFSPAAAKSLAALGSARVQYMSCEDLPTCIPKIAKCGIQPATKKKGYKSEKLGNEVYMYMEQMEDASRLKRKHLNYVQNKNAVACEVHDA